MSKFGVPSTLFVNQNYTYISYCFLLTMLTRFGRAIYSEVAAALRLKEVPETCDRGHARPHGMHMAF